MLMKFLFPLLLFAAISFAKPLVVYTGVYSVSEDKSLGNIKLFAPMFFEIFSKWQASNALPFDLVLETDAEETKHLAADPISMAILVTRDDLQIEHFKRLKVTKTTQNLGFSVLFYQSRKTDNGTVNTILAALPLNSYMSNEKPLSTSEKDPDRAVMTKKIADELIRNRFAKRVRKLGIDEIEIAAEYSEGECRVKDFKKKGLEIGQSVTLNTEQGDFDAYIVDAKGSLEFEENGAKELISSVGVAKGKASNLKGYSEETWQVVNVEITSKKAAQLFQNEPTQAQIAQWYSDFLSETGKAVLPPISGLKWTQNSMGYTEMILASDDGDMEKFVMAPARYRVTLGFSGVANGVVKKNTIEEIWAYKIWLTNKTNNQKAKEEEFTTSKKVTVQSQEHREIDVFRDLLHVSVKKLATKGE